MSDRTGSSPAIRTIKRVNPNGITRLIFVVRDSNRYKCNSPVDCCSPGSIPATPQFSPQAKMQIESCYPHHNTYPYLIQSYQQG